MDIPQLQHRLRQFAAARDWQGYHAPKNLAMALMVEAAELLELFQWQTLTESRDFTRHPADKEKVADEIADVLLYLLQLADHTGVDVEQALEHKLRKNAEKYPAKHPAPPSPSPSPSPSHPAPTSATPKVHLLVDWENVQPSGPSLQELAPEGSDVWLFHAPQQRVDDSSHQQAYAGRVTLVPRSGTGKNALDFQLTYYVGYIAARQPQATFIVVSNDQGYDPMLEHARELGFDARRCDYRKPAKPPAPALAPALATPSAIEQAVESAWSNLRLTPLANRPRQESAVLDYIQLFIAPTDPQKEAIARKARQILLDRGDLPPPQAPRAIQTPVVKSAPPASVPTPDAAPVAASVAPPTKKPPAVKTAKAAPTAPSNTKVTTEEVQKLTQVLNSLSPAKRPTNKTALRALLQKHLGEANAQALRVAHALARLQALKRVIVKKEAVSYPAPATVAVATKPAKKVVAKQATPASQTAAQIAHAVLASLKKMPNNKPTRRAGLLKFIETHASKAANPQAMALQVYVLLETRKDVLTAPDGKGISYPKKQ